MICWLALLNTVPVNDKGNEMIEFLYSYVKPLKSETILIQTKENCPKFLPLRILQSLFKLKNIVQLCQ